MDSTNSPTTPQGAGVSPAWAAPGAVGLSGVVGVVGVGASAGGLPALQDLLAHAPVATGLAWVVVQHLDPTRETALALLLQRATTMPVLEAKERLPVCADTVYVIPPNATLTLERGHLHVTVPAEPRGLRHPVDDLFESLARALGPRAAGVVLSGAGADGARGIRALHAAGGVTAAQQPESAQFDLMPRSALRTGAVQVVAPPGGLAQEVVRALSARQPTLHGPEHGPAAQRLQTILRLMQARGLHDFSLYKRSTLLRRIERRMGIHRMASMQAYAELLARDDAELGLLAKELLIGVTAFFRDTPVWQALKQEVLPALLKAHEDGWHMRAWVAGCSTGEEAYSLAITFLEVLEALPAWAHCSLQVFATDLSKDAIDRARRGVYPPSIAGEVSAQRLQRFFTPHDAGWRIAKEVREMVVFAPHDLAVDPPFTRLDLLSCRNLMIYLTAPLQRRLLPLFHYSLRADGVLLLGSSETIGRFDDLFETTDARLRLYRRRQVARMVTVPDFTLRPAMSAPSTGAKEALLAAEDQHTEDHQEGSEPALNPLQVAAYPQRPNTMPQEDPSSSASLQVMTDRFLAQQWAPPCVVVNDSGDILYINGRTGRYLEPAAGKANWNVHVMAREGLRAPLAAALRQAAKGNTVVELHGLPLTALDGTPAVDVSVQPMQESSGVPGRLLIVFRDIAPPVKRRASRARSALHQELQLELQRAREDAQSLREEMRASQEELQAANEELQSTNEELQSTNEELTSSKEEMQAMNEELQAVNAELQAKLDDLAIAQSDMRNLLNSTDIATLFLDKSLQVRRFTERARKVIRLRDGDVGRPLSDLTTSLDYPELEDDVRDMLRTLVVCEKQVRSREGRWYAVRILPYRTQDDVIDGAVVTFVDVSAAKGDAVT